MQLSIILALLGALVAAQAAPHESLPDIAQRTMLGGLLMALVVIAARIVAAASVAGLQTDSGFEAWPLRYQRLRKIHALAWGLSIAAIYFGLGWPQIVRENLRLRDVFLLDDVLILLPVILSLFLTWWAWGWADQALESRRAERLGQASRPVGGLRATLRLAQHLLAPVLVPLLLVVAAQDVAARYAAETSFSAANIFLIFPLLLVIVIGFPWMLCYLWRTESLAVGVLRDRLRQVEQRLGVRTRDVLIWHTDDTICNAVVVGFFPGSRYVLLSDGLIQRMSPDQVAAVYAHELGHARRGHVLLRLLAVVLPIVLCRALAVTFPDAWAAASEVMTASGLVLPAQVALLTLLGAACYATTIFSWYCRVLEHEADLSGCQGVADAKLFCSALRTLSAVTQSSQQATRASWLHPAMTDRIALVESMAGSPEQRARFTWRMRRLAWLLLALVAALTAWPHI